MGPQASKLTNWGFLYQVGRKVPDVFSVVDDADHVVATREEGTETKPEVEL